METEYLKEYVAFSKTLNYAKAADDLFISQPTLRSHIRALEDEVGAPLTHRRNNRLELSPTGKVFLTRAREILDLVDATLHESRSATSEYSTITVGTIGCWWFEELLFAARRNFEQRNPGKHIEVLFAAGMHANIESLLSGEEEVCLYPHARGTGAEDVFEGAEVPAGLACRRIKTEQHWFWMTDENPLFGNDVITARDLAACTLVVGNTRNMMRVAEIVQEAFRGAGLELEVRCWPFMNYSEYFFSGGRDTFGIYMKGITPDLEARKNFRVFTIEGLEIINDACMIYNESRLNECGRAYVEEVGRLIG